MCPPAKTCQAEASSPEDNMARMTTAQMTTTLVGVRDPRTWASQGAYQQDAGSGSRAGTQTQALYHRVQISPVVTESAMPNTCLSACYFFLIIPRSWLGRVWQLTSDCLCPPHSTHVLSFSLCSLWGGGKMCEMLVLGRHQRPYFYLKITWASMRKIVLVERHVELIRWQRVLPLYKVVLAGWVSRRSSPLIISPFHSP